MTGKLTDKAYLSQGIRISIRTITIGILAILEEEFGELWGHGLDVSELTEDQQQYREQWEQVRARIRDRSRKSQDILLQTLRKFSVRKLKNFQDGNFI